MRTLRNLLAVAAICFAVGCASEPQPVGTDKPLGKMFLRIDGIG